MAMREVRLSSHSTGTLAESPPGVEMRASDSPNLKDQDESAFRRLLLIMIAALAFAMAMVGVLLFPLLLGRLFTSEGDYSRISDIGQAYGAASAMISAV